jgi:hypothetical protein
MRNVKKTSIRKPEGKNPLGRTRRRWDDNIRINLREIEWRVWTGFMLLGIGYSGGLL